MDEQSPTPQPQPAAPEPVVPQPPTPEPPAEPVPVYPGDNESAGNPVAVVPPERDGGRMMLSTGCLTILLSFVVAAFAGLAGGLVGVRYLQGSAKSVVPAITLPSEAASEPVAAAAAVALSSVVNIDVSGTTTSTADTQGLPQGHPDVPVAGQASGVAYRKAPKGATYILTNDHVVENATEIIVTASDGSRYKASLVGRDPETDIAVVQVPGSVPLIRRGDSDKLVVGQLVVAIGSPYGLQHSVSSGVVSGLHRALTTDYGDGSTTGVYPLVDVIQTDAAINPGNSGGALVDRAGRLVGVNSAIYSESGSSAGIGFAIPAKTAARIADELITGGKVKHPFLGILGQTVDEALAKQENLPANEGALIVEVTKGTSAEKVGLRVNDLIVSLDGRPIRSMDDLILAVRRTGVGQTVTLTLWRDGKRIQVKMPVGDKPTQ